MACASSAIEPSARGAWITSSIAMGSFRSPSARTARKLGSGAQQPLITGSIGCRRHFQPLRDRARVVHPAAIAGRLEDRVRVLDRAARAIEIADRQRRLRQLGLAPAAVAIHPLDAAQL